MASNIVLLCVGLIVPCLSPRISYSFIGGVLCVCLSVCVNGRINRPGHPRRIGEWVPRQVMNCVSKLFTCDNYRIRKASSNHCALAVAVAVVEAGRQAVTWGGMDGPTGKTAAVIICGHAVMLEKLGPPSKHVAVALLTP